MKAIVERSDLPVAVRMRYVEHTFVSNEDAADYGPIALGLRGNAHVFESFEVAGRWVDANADHGDFVIHAVKP